MDKKNSNSNGNGALPPVSRETVLTAIATINESKAETCLASLLPYHRCCSQSSGPKFESNVTCWTSGALLRLKASDVMNALDRHFSGDWGDMCSEDAAANDRAVSKGGGRIVSAYESDGTKFWIITDADRSVTTVLLPEEY